VIFYEQASSAFVQFLLLTLMGWHFTFRYFHKPCIHILSVFKIIPNSLIHLVEETKPVKRSECAVVLNLCEPWLETSQTHKVWRASDSHPNEYIQQSTSLALRFLIISTSVGFSEPVQFVHNMSTQEEHDSREHMAKLLPL
jgi:hypothetical protein